MQTKRELNFKQPERVAPLKKLPHVLFPEISSFLQEKEQALFATCDKTINKLMEHRLLALLLRSVVEGNQEMVITILKKKPELLLQKGRIKDNAGRIFLDASAAELARWCTDVKHMASAMLDVLEHLPNRLQAEEIRQAWHMQNEDYEKNGGLDYLFDDKPFKTMVFSLEPLIKKMTAAARFEAEVADRYGDAVYMPKHRQFWCEHIGREQYLLPAILLQHYCNRRALLIKSFDKSTIDRNLMVFNRNTKLHQNVWEDKAGQLLGRNFAITGTQYTINKPGNFRAPGVTDPSEAKSSCFNLVDQAPALKRYVEKTELELEAFKQRLQQPLSMHALMEEKQNEGHKPSCLIS